jgi:hypothetical protein
MLVARMVWQIAYTSKNVHVCAFSMFLEDWYSCCTHGLADCVHSPNNVPLKGFRFV